MRAQTLLNFISTIRNDEEYYQARLDFHENYEWLEGYWIDNYGQHGFEPFCDIFGEYYWCINALKELAWELACQGCVGNSKRNYEPSGEVIKATMCLLHQAGLDDEQEAPECSTMDCIKARQNDLCDDAEQRASNWGDRSAFEAMMHIVRQIRNNLFHGRKLELRPRQYERNRRLVITGEHITAILLENLVEAERQSI